MRRELPDKGGRGDKHEKDIPRTDGVNITANIRSLKDFRQRLSETKQDALYVLGQMNEKPDQQ